MIPNGYSVTIDDEDRKGGVILTPWTAIIRDTEGEYAASGCGSTPAVALMDAVTELEAITWAERA